MENFFRIIAELIAKEVQEDSETIQAGLQFSPKDKFGDIAFPCFPLAKRMKKSPALIAEELRDKLKPPPEISGIEVEGPYLNFRIDPYALISDVVFRVLKDRQEYGNSYQHHGETAVMDYSSPNIAKPFGIGHLRTTVVGNSLMRIYRSQGYNAIGINHLGDWGTQFGKLIYAYDNWGDQQKLSENPINELFDLYVRFHREAEDNPEIEEEAREWFKKLESGDEKAREYWRQFKELSIKEFDKIYNRLGIDFDYYTGESFYNDKMESVIETLKEKKLAKMSQDALIVDLEEYGMSPCILKKKDEASLYATRDLAAAIYRKETYDFDKLLYIVGVEQTLHFRQLFKVLELMGFKWAKDCHHVELGRIKFEGEEMSTRKGNIIFLEDVLDKSKKLALQIIEEKNPELENKDEVAEKVGIGAVVFAQFTSKRNKNSSFSWDEALNFDGNTGPYLQYTHARLCSLQRKYGQEISDSVDLTWLKQPQELSLSKLVGQFPLNIKLALRDNEPSVVANYLLQVAAEFNTYYQKVRIIVDDSDTSAARMALVNAVRYTIEKGLLLLGIKAPERM
ncbi:MAG: arginine--tRNA ligase [candidate division Zixibacteria bacterium]|nr:arginine--tRNA ligase [candidate division Zixibacteria bacterium]